MRETAIFESNDPVKFIESTQSKKEGVSILGKLSAPFFDLNSATRNGRDYREAAGDALSSDEFKEKIQTRTFFGRLGHPCTEDEMNEDPAVRACVILTDYEKNPKTNMYEGTLEILNNQYGKQLKSLIDAGCVMGVSTRGSGDSYEDASGNEVIAKGTYDFEGLDVVTLPAVKAARVKVLESVQKSQKKKLEELINNSNDKVILENLKITVESSEFANKSQLLESIDKKLSGGVDTIESLANDIAEVSAKLSETEAKLAESEKQLQESKASTGTTEGNEKNVSVSNENLMSLLRSSTKVIESIKKSLVRESERGKSIKSQLDESKKREESLKESYDKVVSEKAVLEADMSALKIANGRLYESSQKMKSQLESLSEVTEKSNNLQESVNKSNASLKSINESLTGYKKKCEDLSKANKIWEDKYSKVNSKYIESVAVAMGISLEELKLKVTPESSVQMIESAAKSIREASDKRRSALPDIRDFGRVVESKVVDLDDPVLDRAGRIASLTKNFK